MICVDVYIRVLLCLDEYTSVAVSEPAQLYEVGVRVTLVSGSTTETVQEVNMADLPHPPVPRQVTVTLRTPTQLALEWTIPDDAPDVTQFTVRYARVMDASEGGVGDYQYVTSDTPSTLITGLQPYTEYEVAVCSHLAAVPGPYSPAIRDRTDQGGRSHAALLPSEITFAIRLFKS